MIGNLQLAKKQNKKEKLEKEIYETTNYKKNQLVTKLYELNKKYFPKMFWNSRKDGTYRKKKKVGI